MADAEELKDNTASEVCIKRIKEKERQLTFPRASGSIRIAEGGPSRHTSTPSRSDLNLVQDTLLGRKLSLNCLFAGRNTN